MEDGRWRERETTDITRHRTSTQDGAAPASGFERRASDFGFPSDFGFRTSDSASALRVAGVGNQREQTEESAEHILAFRHPGHRLDAQRVKGEQRRHQQTPPRRAGHQLQQREDQPRVERVQQHVGQMMSPRLQTEQLAVQHVGPNRQGVPIPAHRVPASPFYALPSQSAFGPEDSR